MLEDRDYMRQPSTGWQWSATIVLVATLVACYLLQITVLPGELRVNYLELSRSGLAHGYVWQLFTFQFLHGGWLHLLLNCWALFLFGREVEGAIGRTRFLTLYFSSGVAGGLLQALAACLWARYFDAPVVGASAGIFGVVSAFALLWPDRVLTMLLFFVIPIRMRARSLLLFSLSFAAAGIAFAGVPAVQLILGKNVAHVAHFGGMLAGLAYIRWIESARQSLARWRPFAKRRPRRELVPAASIRIPRWPLPKPVTPAEDPEAEFISREVDPILEKISAHGIQSLTEHERRILEAARNKMAKR